MVCVKFWANDRWNLSKLSFWQYLFGRFMNEIGPENADPLKYNILHVSKKNIIFD